MAALKHFSCRKVLMLYMVLFALASVLLCACSEDQSQKQQFIGRRRMLLEIEKDGKINKKSNNTLSISKKNQTKLIKPTTNSTKAALPTILNKLKKLNSTSKILNSTRITPSVVKNTQSKKLNSASKPSNSTKSSLVLVKKTLDTLKSTAPKNKTTKPIPNKQTQAQTDKNQSTEKKLIQQKMQKPAKPSWIDEDPEEDDLIKEFRDLPSKFHQTLLPDLERISTSSKAYLNRANKEITEGFKPIVGNKYAPTVASFISCAFILLPLLLVSLIFNRIKAYFSLQKILIFIQVYLAIYFSILCLSSLVTGLEPLKFFYATSRSTYVGLQVLQTLGYVLYLLLLLMNLVVVFSTECGVGSKMLGLGQTFVGLSIGLHYYLSVFHRVLLHQPPKTNWRIHGIYATCFLVICVLAGAERRKKAYLQEGGEEGKKN